MCDTYFESCCSTDIKCVIDNIRERVKLINNFEGRLMKPFETIYSLGIHVKKLVLNCPTDGIPHMRY